MISTRDQGYGDHVKKQAIIGHNYLVSEELSI